MSEQTESVAAQGTSTKRKNTEQVDTQKNRVSKPMSEADLAEKQRLEEIVTNNQLNFVEVGNALSKININEWFGPHKNLNDYCNANWGFSGAYGYRHINAAAVYNHLKQFSPNGEMPLPQNEAQIRPLTKFKKPKQWLKAWKLAVRKAKGGRITEEMVDSVVKKKTGGKKTDDDEEKPTEATPPANDRVPVADIHPGEILKLLADIRSNVEAGYYHEAMKCVAAIELLIKGEVTKKADEAEGVRVKEQHELEDVEQGEEEHGDEFETVEVEQD